MSKKHHYSRPMQNMADVNRLLAQTLEALKKSKADNAELNSQLAQAREKCKSLSKDLGEASMLLMTSDMIIKNQIEMFNRQSCQLHESEAKIADLRAENDREYRLHSNLFKQCNRNRMIYKRLFWGLLLFYAALEIARIVIHCGGL